MWQSVELRELRLYLALAEELHFGRTATKLGVTQSRVSQNLADVQEADEVIALACLGWSAGDLLESAGTDQGQAADTHGHQADGQGHEAPDDAVAGAGTTVGGTYHEPTDDRASQPRPQSRDAQTLPRGATDPAG